MNKLRILKRVKNGIMEYCVGIFKALDFNPLFFIIKPCKTEAEAKIYIMQKTIKRTVKHA